MPYDGSRQKLVGDATEALKLEITAVQDNHTDQVGEITLINGKEYPAADLNEIFLQLINNDVVLNKITAKLAANNTFTGYNDFTNDILLANNRSLKGRKSDGSSYQSLIGCGADNITYLGNVASPTKLVGSTNPVARVSNVDYTMFHKGYMGVSAGLDAGTLENKSLNTIKSETQDQTIASVDLHNILTESFGLNKSSGNLVAYAKNKITTRKSLNPFILTGVSDLVGSPSGWSHGEIIILPHDLNGLYFQLIAKDGPSNKMWLGSYVNGAFGGWKTVADNADVIQAQNSADGKEPKFNKKSGFNKEKSDSVTTDSSIILATAKAIKTVWDTLTNHRNSTSNPHTVTKSQVGLGNVPNYTITDSTTDGSSSKFGSAKAVKIVWDKVLEAIGFTNTNKNAIQNNQEQIENCGIGNNQTWLNVKSSRSFGTTYTNDTPKTIIATVSFSMKGHQYYVDGYIDGVLIKRFAPGTGDTTVINNMELIIPRGSTYRFYSNGYTLTHWSELR
jgi:hypothetical protein